MKHEKFRNFATRGGKKSVLIDYAAVKKAFLVCHSLEHTLRKRILSFFEEQESFTEKEIADKIRLELDVTQEHLRVMVRNKVLNVSICDTEKCYTVNEVRLDAIRKFYTDLND